VWSAATKNIRNFNDFSMRKVASTRQNNREIHAVSPTSAASGAHQELSTLENEKTPKRFGAKRQKLKTTAKLDKPHKLYVDMLYSCIRMVSMLNLSRAGCLMIVAAAPVVVMAQSPQVRPPQQPRPAATPAAAPGTAATPAAQPVHPSPDSRRFVTNENFFHARPKPQPASTDAQPAAAQPANTRPVTVKSTLPVPSKVLPPTSQPAAAIAVPAMVAPQPSAALPAIITPSALNNTGHDLAAVDFSHGELTVVAQRAPLSLILKLIAARTGAVIDLEPELQNEPVVAQLGPAPAREVLAALLGSPKVDYIVMAPSDDPNGVQRVVVRTRLAFARVAMAPIQPPQPKTAETEPEPRLDGNGHLRNGLSSVESNMTQEQRMENWQKNREAMRVAEIKQQAEDREREKTEPQSQPQPQPQPEPQPDNPPQS
jgi:hypothetical protein